MPMQIREYLKLSRSFNAALTGISPVMGAIAMQHYQLFPLFLLFLIGFFGHIFGFVFNDVIDNAIDKDSKDISDRPLVSGTITPKNALLFAISAMILACLIAVYLAYSTSHYIPLVLLMLSALCIVIYDLISKKLPFMDIFVALGVFFLIAYGASIQSSSFTQISSLAWIVCILGAIQVLFMQIVAGGLKDIENDFQKGAKTAAIQLGVRVKDKIIHISYSFKLVAYGIQLADFALVFYIIFTIKQYPLLTSIQIILLLGIASMMFLLTYKLFSLQKWERGKVRAYIGSHYMINFALVPILLMINTPWTIALVFFPAIGFLLSNLILHKTLLQPKTM